jgi:O-antigen/teichoic acid export membrane protein
LKSLSARTIHGVSWNLIATASSTVMQIGYTAIMARLLSPSDFGLMAMAMVIVKFGDHFSKMGMAQTLVQKPDLSNDDIRSVFTSSVAMGIIFTAMMYFSAPLFMHVFDNENVVPVIKVLSINFLLKGLSITSTGLLGKELEFKKIAIINIITFTVCNMGIGVYLAYRDYGVYSLVYAGIVQQFLMLVISFGYTRHDIKPLFNWKVYKPLLSFGSRISVISILEYIGANLDTFLIAKFYGALNVGLYNKARMLVYLPAYKLTTSVSGVMFPAFSKLQNNKKKLGKAYLSSTTLMSALLFPICFGVFSASNEIVLVVLGAQWVEAIPILQMLAFAVPFLMITQFGGMLCEATAKLKSKLILQTSYVAFLSIAFYLFRNSGFLIFPVIIFIGIFIRNFGYIVAVSRITNLSVKEIVLSYWPGVSVGTIVGATIYLVTYLASFINIPDLATLIIQIMTGGIVLCIFILMYPHKKLKYLIVERFSTIDKVNVVLKRFKWYRQSVNTV